PARRKNTWSGSVLVPSRPAPSRTVSRAFPMVTVCPARLPPRKTVVGRTSRHRGPGAHVVGLGLGSGQSGGDRSSPEECGIIGEEAGEFDQRAEHEVEGTDVGPSARSGAGDDLARRQAPLE